MIEKADSWGIRHSQSSERQLAWLESAFRIMTSLTLRVAMNYQKLDAALSLKLDRVENREEARFAIFIHIQSISTAEAMTLLKQFGVENPNGTQSLITATLSARAVAEVSEQPWVKYMRLSQVLSPINHRS
jgi:hypothetical protein